MTDRRSQQSPDEAMAAYRAKDYATAARLLGAVCQDKDAARVHLVALARSLDLTGCQPEAESVWRRLLDQNAEDASALAALAQVRYAARDYDEATSLYRRALVSTPDDGRLRLLAARAAELAGQWTVVTELTGLADRPLSEVSTELWWQSAVACLLAQGDDLSAEQLLQHRLSKIPDDLAAKQTLATLLTRQYRVSEIESLALDESEITSSVAMLGLVRAAIRDRDPARAKSRLKLFSGLTRSRETIDDLAGQIEAIKQEQSLEAERRGPYPRVIALLGLSFCGSTLLGSMLGSLPGVAHVGESHRLVKSIDWSASGFADQPFDFENDDPARLTPCHTCGAECAIFDFEFRKALQSDPRAWFARLSERSDASVLVSGDKGKTQKLDPLQRHDAILLFKQPANAYRSMRKRALAQPDNRGYRVSGSGMGDIYARDYRQFLGLGNPQGRRICLNWESFIEAPEAHLQRLCELLDLPFDALVLRQRNPDQHAFGGNAEVRHQFSQQPDRFSLQRMAAEATDSADERAAGAHAGAKLVYDQMMEMYRTDFAQ